MLESICHLPGKLISPTKQIVLYFGVVFGVFFSDILMQFRINSHVDIFQLYLPLQLEDSYLAR